MRNVFLFFLILCGATVVSQKLNLGKVTKAELQEKQHKADTSAAAAILFKKAKIDYNFTEEGGFSIVTVFQVKLKVYKKEGLKWANFKIPYYIGYENLEDEYVEIISGYTYNLENDKIIKTKVTGESKFKQKVNENWAEKLVTFPNVKEGSIIELEYKLKSENLSVLPEFKYQYEIPVDFAEFKSNIPEFYLYKTIRKGFVEVSTAQKMEYASQSFQSKADKSNITKTLQYQQIASTYVASDIPALKEEDYVNNMSNYYAELDNELQTIRYPDQQPKQIATTWEAIAKSIYDDKDFAASINAFNYFTNDIRSTLNGATTDKEKAKKILSFLKSRMNWNGRYGYYPSQKVETAYAEKVGNVGDINLILTSMLRMAAIDANPVLVSTRENGVALFPNRTLFNYLVVAAQIDGQTVLFDATDKLSDMNVLPIRALNGVGRLIKNDGTSKEIDLMPKSNSNDIVNVMANVNEKGEVSGKIREQYLDYNAFVFRDKYNGIAKESYIEKLEKKFPGMEIADYEVQNSLDLNLPIIENYSFTSTNSVETIGDKMYLSPFLLFETSQNPFKQETRLYPIDFVFPRQFIYNLSITIPSGYAIETLPEPKTLLLPDKFGGFKYNASANGNQLQLRYSQEINQAIFPPEYYEALKTFFKQLVEKQTEKIVLKKV